MSDFAPTRRTFVSSLAALTGVAALRPRLAVSPGDAPLDALTLQQEEWDLSWVDRLTGKHRQIFDSSGADLNDVPFRVVRNWLNAARDVLKLQGADVTTIVGSTNAYPALASDAMWATYHLGEHWKVKDPATGEWATKNVVVTNETAGATALMARGTIFWQCNNALRGISGMVAASGGKSPAEAYTELRAGLLPGVKVVPAHTLLIGLVQEKGCCYQKL